MARKTTSLDDPFLTLTEELEERINPDEELKSNTETKDGSETLNSNTEQNNVSETEQSSVTNKSNTETNQSKSSESGDTTHMSIKDYEKRLQRLTVEDTHTRVTFLLDNDLKDKLDKLCKNKKRGFKNSILNDAVREMLRQFGK